MRFYFLCFLSLSFLCACTGARSTNAATPIVASTQLSIFPGEQVYVEVAVQDNVIVGIQKVSNIIDPKSTMNFQFVRDDNRKLMTLTVENPFATPVKYHIDLVDYQGKLHHTSSCPVLAGGSVYETWPHPIPELRITNFHFASGEEQTVCIY